MKNLSEFLVHCLYALDGAETAEENEDHVFEYKVAVVLAYILMLHHILSAQSHNLRQHIIVELRAEISLFNTSLKESLSILLVLICRDSEILRHLLIFLQLLVEYRVYLLA